MLEKMGIGWQVGLPSGWGVYGLNLAVQLARKKITPVPLMISADMNINPLQHRLLKSAFRNCSIENKFADIHGKAELTYPVLHGMSNALDMGILADKFNGSPNIGVIFFETVLFPEGNVEKAKDVPLIITGSSWNTKVLKENYGMTNIEYCPQGVDLSLFHPAPRTNFLKDKFIVFSGGKLEYRKGQDIVVAAYKIFHERHPDSILMTAWSNRWPESIKLLEISQHVEGIPECRPDRSIDVGSWLVKNGLPADSFIDLGEVSNTYMPLLLREADVALFTNRCEGGTNLVAMECMACGLPVILSSNTGHFDLISENENGKTCYVLEEQIDLGEALDMEDFSDWGESSVEEAVAKLEEAYTDSKERLKRGKNAADFMLDWSWENQITRLVETVEKHV